MRSVLISIRPKYVELIAIGKKTIEVRKTSPKIGTPFKCYIYCTKPKMITKYVFKPEDYPEYMRPEKTVFCKVPDASSPFCSEVNGNGKVIGEFVCDNIKTYYADDFVGAEDVDGTIITEPKDGEFSYWIPEEKETCLPYEEILSYGNGKPLYGWHISDLKIYDKPRELREFWAYNEELHKRYDSERDFCCYDGTNEYGESLTDCGDAYNNILNCYRCWEEWSGWSHHVTRPPQSWMYVEELQ